MATKSKETKSKSSKKPVTKSKTRPALETKPTLIQEPKPATIETKSARSTYDPDKSYLISKNLLRLAAIALVLMIAVGVVASRRLLVAATVNGSPVSRLELIQRLESQNGQTALDSLITEKLILQEATKQNIVVDQTAIDEEIKKIEDQLTGQGMTLDQALESEGISRAELTNQIRLQKLVEQLAGDSQEASAGAIADFIEQNDAFLPKEATDTEKQDIAKEQLASQSRQQKVQETITNLRSQANINYWLQL